MLVGNDFNRVCLSVHPSVCLSVQAITFELLHIGTSFLVTRYILTISRSSLSIEVIGLRSCAKKCLIIYSFVCSCGSLIRSRSHIKVKVIFKERYFYAVVCI